MEQNQVSQAARSFSRAADAMVDACRQLEQLGVRDEPIEGLLQALEAATREVHKLHPPEARLQFEPADTAPSMSRMASSGVTAVPAPGARGTSQARPGSDEEARAPR